MRPAHQRLALIAAVALSLPIALAATPAGAHGCGRHGGRDASMGRFAFNRALLGGKGAACVEKSAVAERRARPAAHGGFFEVHGRYQH